MPRIPEERVYGHAPVPGQEEHPIALAMRDVMAQEKTRRRNAKAALAGALYHERGAFAPGLDRRGLMGAPQGPDFLTRFDPGGHYQQAWDALQVTKTSVSSAVQRTDWGKDTTFEAGETPHETKVVHKGQHVYTLYRGASAWMAPVEAASSSSGSSSAALARRIFRKHGGGEKEYVHDDANVPTRRFAYAVKDQHQVGVVAEGTLRGRYLLNERDAPRLGDDIMKGTRTEQAMLNKPGIEDLTENEMLAIHQEQGSGKRQRGVAASSSPAPLLSNEARGFAQEHPDGRKLRIDLATIPLRGPTQSAPNLRNFHQRIPGYEDARVRLGDWHYVEKPRTNPRPGKVQHRAERQQEHFDWSVAKNRELFIRELSSENVTGTASPSSLETMRYIGPTGAYRAPPHVLAAEYERVRRHGDYSTPLPPSVQIGAPSSPPSSNAM